MNVILTWSKKASEDLALFLREWLKDVVSGVDTWVSTEDIQKGKRWFQELMNKFQDTHFLIMCITAENARSPWIYYEVGLIAAKQEEATTCPYLVGVPVKIIQGTPLSEFQCTEADKTDTWRLVKSINKELKEKANDEASLKTRFDSQWPRLKEKIDKIVSEVPAIEDEVTSVQSMSQPRLRPAAKRLLLDAAADNRGKIYVSRDGRGFSISTNGHEFVGSQDQKLWAKWKGAVDELEQLGYINNLGGHGQVFDMKDKGYERAEDLKTNDLVFSLTAEAKHLLTEAAAADGVIIFAKNQGGDGVMVAGHEFTKPDNSEESAKWIDGVNQLRERSFIQKDTDESDESAFRVQKVGYDAAKDLN